MKIRKGKSIDADQCFAISCAESHGPEMYDSFTRQTFIDNTKDADAIFLVVVEGKEIMGFVVGFVVPTNKKEAMVHEVHVAEKHRGKRIGSELIDAFCAEASKRKVNTIYAEVTLERLSFYKNNSFKKSTNYTEVYRKIK